MSKAAKLSTSGPSSSPITIAVLENDPLRFLGVRTILEFESDFRVVASDPRSIVGDACSDVVLVSSRDRSTMFEIIAALKSVRPGIKVIVTGAGKKDEDVLQAISSGAKGYLDEAATPAEYRQAIRIVHGGSVWAPRYILSRFIERATSGARQITEPSPIAFSERERQVLKLLVEGHTNREIGALLGIEERTVKSYIAKLMQKVGVSNRIALSVHALTHALVRASD